MNVVVIVLPILTLLMFELGLTLSLSDFRRALSRPLPLVVGLVGQLVVLPLLAWALVSWLSLPREFLLGLMLIALCPGGSSSNVFSLLAGGDVALSVSLTAASSVLTLFTLPLVMMWAVAALGGGAEAVTLPVGNLIVQNLLLMFLPIVAGLALRRWRPLLASSIERRLSRVAFPALMLLAGLFFLQHHATIALHWAALGGGVTLLILLASGASAALAWIFRLRGAVRRTIFIEVGMQNAAQAIAVASSPFIFNNTTIAVPAIIYALMMNIVLLSYVALVRRFQRVKA